MASMERIIYPYAKLFKLDNPIAHQGCGPGMYSELDYRGSPGTILDIDVFGVPAAFLRGLLGIEYLSDSMILHPRVPKFIVALQQRFPIRWGSASVYFQLESEKKKSQEATQTVIVVKINNTICHTCIISSLDEGDVVQIPWSTNMESSSTSVTMVFANSASKISTANHIRPGYKNVSSKSQDAEDLAKKWGKYLEQRMDVAGAESHAPKECKINKTISSWVHNATKFRDALRKAGNVLRWEYTQACNFLQAVRDSVERCRGRLHGTIDGIPDEPDEWHKYDMVYDQAAAESYFPDVYGRIWFGLQSSMATRAKQKDRSHLEDFILMRKIWA